MNRWTHQILCEQAANRQNVAAFKAAAWEEEEISWVRNFSAISVIPRVRLALSWYYRTRSNDE